MEGVRKVRFMSESQTPMKTSIHKNAGPALAIALILAPISALAQVELEVTATGTLGGDIDSATDVNATLSDSVIEVNVGTGAATGTDEDDSDGSETALMLNAEGIAIRSAAAVRAEADLEAFRHNLEADHEGIEEVRIDTDAEGSTEVEVRYRHSGKLFGFMPVTVRSTTLVTVNANGGVEVESNVPWWSLVVSSMDHAGSEIEDRIKDNPTVMTNAEAELSARAKAEIAEAVVAELQAHTTLQASLYR